ncbi:MAG: hypothetical protein CMM45_04100 [Rhodospirillaceae bacterium]|nr:hypothetical protein [Rhodospirillaceae bacterium]
MVDCDYEVNVPRQTVELDGYELSFRVPNEITQWRIEHLVAVEPITIAWILGFAPEDILVDIGAGIGVFTVTAALCRHTQVYAFEPQAQSFAVLCGNIEDNGLNELVNAWPAAITDTSGFDILNVMHSGAGNAHHSFGEAVNYNLHPQKFLSSQGSVSTTLDYLVAEGVVPVPTHIKIDVDGFEYKVIAGAAATLKNPGVRSVLVEINSGLVQHNQIFGVFRQLGFAHDPELTERTRRTEGMHKGIGEVVFRR